MIKLAVFGAPVQQSRSPAIHSMFARQCGLEIDYRAIEATRENFPERVKRLATEGGLGCNITAPFKSMARSLARRHSPSAARAKAANTLVFERPDDWYADNTDGRGLLRDLEIRLHFDPSGARICIIGAGGATAGILGDFLDRRPTDLAIANRTLERAKELATSFGGPVRAVPLSFRGETGPFDLVINATSLGHTGTRPELPESLFHSDTLFYDLNYGKASHPLAEFCTQHQIRFSDGLGMLVEQAALSFQLWTGVSPDTDPVLSKLRLEL